MYWNDNELKIYNFDTKININMRCIEMYPKLLGDAVTARLTLTWDVLK